MGIKQLEAAIMVELRQVANNKKLRLSQLMEWRTGQNSVKIEAGETYVYLPGLGVSCSVKLPAGSGPTTLAVDTAAPRGEQISGLTADGDILPPNH